MTRFTLVLALLAVAVACAPKRIPGTELDDTPDTRAIVMVIDRFRTCLEAKDITGLVSIAAPNFHDEAGTPDPEDDLDVTSLEGQLARRFSRLWDIRVQVDIRKIEVDAEKNSAKVIYFYTLTYRPTAPGGKAERDSDLKQMMLSRPAKGQEWKVVSGM